MTETVVDGLEAIEVQHEHREEAGCRTASGKALVEALVEERAVGKVGERVVRGHAGDARFGRLALGHVLHDHHVAASADRLLRQGEDAAVREVEDGGRGLPAVQTVLEMRRDLRGLLGRPIQEAGGPVHDVPDRRALDQRCAQAEHLAEPLVDDHEPLVGIDHAERMGHVAEGCVEALVLDGELARQCAFLVVQDEEPQGVGVVVVNDLDRGGEVEDHDQGERRMHRLSDHRGADDRGREDEDELARCDPQASGIAGRHAGRVAAHLGDHDEMIDHVVAHGERGQDEASDAGGMDPRADPVSPLPDMHRIAHAILRPGFAIAFDEQEAPGRDDAHENDETRQDGAARVRSHDDAHEGAAESADHERPHGAVEGLDLLAQDAFVDDVLRADESVDLRLPRREPNSGRFLHRRTELFS